MTTPSIPSISLPDMSAIVSDIESAFSGLGTNLASFNSSVASFASSPLVQTVAEAAAALSAAVTIMNALGKMPSPSAVVSQVAPAATAPVASAPATS